jgi:hypothetical protein
MSSIDNFKSQWANYKKWDQEWNEKEAKRKALYSRVDVPQPDLVHAKKLSRTIENAVEVVDENTENACNNIDSIINPLSIAASAVAIVGGALDFSRKFENWQNAKEKAPDEKALLELNKIHMNKLGKSVIGSSVLLMGIGMGFSLVSSKLQILGSKIARYQTHEDLADPKNFVMYDDDQIEKAKELVKKGQVPKVHAQKRTKEGFFESLFSMMHDYKDYQKWDAEHDKKALVMPKPNPTPEELKKAKADQDAILRNVKAVNDKAKDYSESMESASGAILNIAVAGGGTLGILLSKVADKIKLKKHNISLSDFAINKLINSKKLKDKKITVKIEDLLKNKKMRGNIISWTIGLISGILSIPWTLSLKRDASRTGRFIARKEFQKDEKSCVYFDEKQMTRAKDVKGAKPKRNIIKKMWDDLMFVPTSIKQSKEFENYKSTQGKENKQIREALNYVELKPGQIEEAKNIQKKILLSLKKIDEKSLENSEQIGAYTDAFQTALPYLIIGGAAIVGRNKLHKLTESNDKLSLGVTLGAAAKLTAVYLLNVFTAYMQKCAGEMGIMEATEELKDPRYFVDKFSTEPQKQTLPAVSDTKQKEKMQLLMSKWVAGKEAKPV